MIRNYSELSKLKTFEERFEYLRLDGEVGKETFGFDRIFNQQFYRSAEWKLAKRNVIIRDLGCDLGIEDREIWGRIVIHHMNPITLSDIENHTKFLLDPEFLVTTTPITHNAIHYGDSNLLVLEPIARSVNDTCPWRK